MKGFFTKQDWLVAFTTERNVRFGLQKHYVEALGIDKALNQAKKDLPPDAQIVRIELSRSQRG